MSAKIIIAAVAGVAVVGLAGYGLYRKFRKPVEDDALVTELEAAAKSKSDHEFEKELKAQYCGLCDSALQATRDGFVVRTELSNHDKLHLVIIDKIIMERKLSNPDNIKSAE